MLLGDFLGKNMKDSLYAKTKEGKSIMKDAPAVMANCDVCGKMKGVDELYDINSNKYKQVCSGCCTVLGIPKSQRKPIGDSDVIININMGEEKAEIIQEEPVVEEPISATEGTVYKGYSIKQEDDGTFTIFSIGGARITETESLEQAMNIINGISVDEGE